MLDLLLVADVPKLGKRGDRVKVKVGYARNYLLPKRMAVYVNTDTLRMVEKARVKWLAEEAKKLEELRELATHVEKLDLLIVAKAAENGSLYGSVGPRDIAAKAASEGVALDASVVRMPEALKQVADYEVLIHLHEEVEVTIPVRVRAEGREDWLPGENDEERGEHVSSEPEEGEDGPSPLDD